jgi:hypothetical protein
MKQGAKTTIIKDRPATPMLTGSLTGILQICFLPGTPNAE